MEKDIYVEKYLKMIKGRDLNNDKELIEIINKIYEDGFTDGSNEGNTDL